MGGRLCSVICEFVVFFDGEVISPVGDFDISLEMFYIGDVMGKFVMNGDFL